MDGPQTLWIFGYGSLVWNPGFDHKNSRVGAIRGFARRFWQGNVVQRGSPSKPGRVATLIEDPESVTWGKAFELGDESALSALDYLNTREAKLGGYRTRFVTFEPADPSETPFSVLLYEATSDNQYFLGPAAYHEIADQIVDCRGNCGHNVEYLIRLADFMREEVPHACDEHLFTLESLVLTRLKERNLNLRTLMGDKMAADDAAAAAAAGDGAAAAAAEPEPPRPNNFQFTATLPSKNLRCLKV